MKKQNTHKRLGYIRIMGMYEIPIPVCADAKAEAAKIKANWTGVDCKKCLAKKPAKKKERK